tara:strand:+ start:403 stop:930 length:528 start_codon:yes stop_codon:yes gene_type:complete
MKLIKTKFSGIFKIKGNKKKDDRGYLLRNFCKNELKKKSINFNIKQTNISYNKSKGTFRGFHYQKKPNSEKKIINCFKGSIFLYVLDIDKKSENYLHSLKFLLKENDTNSIYISKNYATAFITLKKNTIIFYYMSEFFVPSKSAGIKFDDPKIKINLPFKPKVISKKDLNIKLLK